MRGLGNVRPVDPILTQYGVEYRQAQTALIADRVAPWIQTDGDTGTYYIADALNNLNVEDTAWSYTQGASRVESAYTARAFKAKPYGLEEAIPDAYVRNWLAGGDDLKRRATTALQDRMALPREVRVFNFFDALAPTNNAAQKWDGSGTASSPRADIISEQGLVWKRIGKAANAIIICAPVWRNLIGSQAANSAGALIVQAIQYTQKALGSAITPDLVAQYFNVDFCFPAMAIKPAAATKETTGVNTDGLPAAGLDVWSNKEVYTFYLETSPGPQTINYLTTFGPYKGSMDQYRDDRVMADIVRITETLVEHVTCTNAVSALGTVIT